MDSSEFTPRIAGNFLDLTRSDTAKAEQPGLLSVQESATQENEPP